MKMKTILGLLIAVSAAIALAGGAYEFRSPTARDKALAQLAGDWMFHDDWHAPIPTNAYATRWQMDKESRATLPAKHTTIPIDVSSGSNTFALFTYNVKDRTLAERPAAPDPWPTPRIIVEEAGLADGRPQLKVSWSGGLWYFLGVREETNGPVVVSINRKMYVD